MAEEDVVELLRQMLTQMEAQQQALVRLTEVLDQYLKNPVRVDVVANAPKVSLADDAAVGIKPPNNHVVVDSLPDIRDKRAPGIEVFQRDVEVKTSGFPQPSEAETPIGVPAGKRLVIEYIAVMQAVGAVYLRTIAGGVGVKHPIVTGQTRIYADPGASLFLRVEKGGGGAIARVVISGHLIAL